MHSLASTQTIARRWTALGGVVLIIAGLAAYSNSFSVPFVLDDTVSILENPSIRQLSPLGAVLAPPEEAGVGGRPLVNLSFALNYAMGGTTVTGYHVVNLVIHLAAALTLFGLVRRTLAAPTLAARFREETHAPLALVVALLWLLHPLQTEAVTYVSQRAESLMGLFFLFTLYAFVRSSETRSRVWFAATVAICTCGMATKEVMVTAPVIVLLFDRTFVSGNFRNAWQQRRWFYLALATTWLVLAFNLSGIPQRGVGYATVTWWQYALTECGALLTYLRLTVWPAPLVFDYGAEFARIGSDAIFPATVIVALLTAVVITLWRAPVWGFVGAWFFVLLSPTSSIVPIAGQPMAEHRMYLPLAALLAAVAFAVFARFGRSALLGLAAFATLGGFLTFRRNADYHTASGLWRDTIAKCPTNPRAHAALGAVWLREKKIPEAIAELETALRANPNDAHAHNNLATALQDTGRLAEAIAHYQASARLDPTSANTYYNLGNALLEFGRPTEAIAAQERSLSLKPNLAVAHSGLGNALAAVDRTADAIPQYVEALRLAPDLAPTHFALANLLANSGRLVDSLPHFEATLQAYPNVPEAHFNFAMVLARTGHTTEAIAQFETAVRLKPDFVEAQENLATLRAAVSPVGKQ